MSTFAPNRLRHRVSLVRSLHRRARVMAVAVCLALCSCSSPPWATQRHSPTPTPLTDEYLCDIVPASVLNESLKFRTGQAYYSHSGGNGGISDRWECTLISPRVSPDNKQTIKIEYIDHDHWNTSAGWAWSPLKESVPEDEKLNVDPVTLPGHEGQGWIIGSPPNVEDRPILAWQYPNGYYLVVSKSYTPGAPAPDSNLQALEDLALAVIDKIPPIAAEPGYAFTVYPDDSSTDKSAQDN